MRGWVAGAALWVAACSGEEEPACDVPLGRFDDIEGVCASLCAKAAQAGVPPELWSLSLDACEGRCFDGCVTASKRCCNQRAHIVCLEHLPPATSFGGDPLIEPPNGVSYPCRSMDPPPDPWKYNPGFWSTLEGCNNIFDCIEDD